MLLTGRNRPHLWRPIRVYVVVAPRAGPEPNAQRDAWTFVSKLDPDDSDVLIVKNFSPVSVLAPNDERSMAQRDASR